MMIIIVVHVRSHRIIGGAIFVLSAHIPLKFKYRKKFSFQSFFSLFFFVHPLVVTGVSRAPVSSLILSPGRLMMTPSRTQRVQIGGLSRFFIILFQSQLIQDGGIMRSQKERDFIQKKRGKKFRLLFFSTRSSSSLMAVDVHRNRLHGECCC